MNHHCKKTSFDTQADAILRLREIQNSGEKREDTPKRVYRCHDCRKFHLTKSSGADAEKFARAVRERVQKREEKFIRREAQFWAKRFGLDSLE